MPDDAARRAHQLFVRALDVDSGIRDGFIARECAGDRTLEARVRRLVNALDRSTNFLEKPALTLSLATTPRTSDPIGVTVPGYRLVRVLGSGGMGTVFEAVQEQPERTVALKVLRRGLENTSAVRRFRYETEVLARLRHPGIAQIYEAGTCGDGAGPPLPFFAMEFIEDARTIIEHAQRHHLPLRARLQMMAEVCDAVQHGHQLGVIHRDLKPANILVDRHAHARIIDFGVARPARAEAPGEGPTGITGRLEFGQLIGTLSSMSPEQCDPRAGVDVRTDVYSLGVVLYHLVADQPPYDLSAVSIPEAVRIICQDRPPRLGSIAPAARGDLEAIVAKAMEKDPARRYAGAGALAADIRRYLGNQTIDARPPSVSHQARLFARRHRVLVGAASASLVVLLVSSALVGLFAWRAMEEARQRRDAETTILRERDAARMQAYIAAVASGFASARSGEYAQARRRLEETSPQLRNWEWRLVSALTERGERTIAAHDDMVFAFAMSPDGARFATGSRDGGLSVWDAGTGEQLASLPDKLGAPVLCLAFGHDGARLVAGCANGDVRVLEADTCETVRVLTARGTLTTVACDDRAGLVVTNDAGDAWRGSLDVADLRPAFRDQPQGVTGASFSRRGDRLVTWNDAGEVWVRHAHDDRPLERLTLEQHVQCAAFSPDSSLLAAGGIKGRLQVWRLDATTGARALGPMDVNTSVRSLAFSRDNCHLASGQGNRAITIWEVDTMQALDRRLGHAEGVAGVGFAPGGGHLISASWDRTVRLWPLGENAGAGPLRIVKAHDGNALCVAYSPDGALLATAGRDDMIRLWDAALLSELALLEGHEQDVYTVVFSPDGSLLASSGDDRTVRTWNTRTGTPADVLGPFDASVWCVDFSPDGRRIAWGTAAGEVHIRDLQRREDLARFRAHDARVNAIRFSPDGSTLATGSRDGAVRLWDASTGSPRATTAGHGADVFALIFSADGTRLFSGSRDQTVGVWRSPGGQPVSSLSSDGQFITSLALSPDGTRLAAGSWFAEGLLWDTATLELVASYKAHNSTIRSVAFSPDGHTLVCAGHDGTFTAYNVLPHAERGAQLERATDAADRIRREFDQELLRNKRLESAARLLEERFAGDPEATRAVRNELLRRSPRSALQ